MHDKPSEKLREGLSLLAGNIKTLDYHRSQFIAACEAVNAPPDFNELKKIPEYMAWRELKAAMSDELRAAANLTLRELGKPIQGCRKLAVWLESGQYEYNSPLAIEALAEIEAILEVSHGVRADSQPVKTSEMARRLRFKGGACTSKQLLRAAGLADNGRYAIEGFPPPVEQYDAPKKGAKIYAWDAQEIVRFCAGRQDFSVR